MALVAFGLTLATLAGLHGSNRHLDALGVVLAAFASFPLVLHRRRPLGVFAFTTAASAVLNALGYGLGPPFGPTFALFYVAADDRARSRLRETATVVVAMFAIHVSSTLVSHEGFPTSPILFGVVVWGGAWVTGDQVRQRRDRREALVEQARRAEQELASERRIAAAEERTRIARDLHDSAAHAINVILVQAGAVRLLQQDNPSAAREALTTIEEVARETIGEIDQLVRTLRDDAGVDAAEIEPAPGLAALETLVSRMGAAGLDAGVRVGGAQRPLPRRIDQAAYRILQESLTNAVRHGTGPAEVELTYSEGGIDLVVSNPMPPGTGADVDGGHGILGMRERALLAGGRLQASAESGRFVVRAWLPTGPRPS
ncbi:MAG TPA: histidine kinase [Gaiellales bacterium]|nr:histidine kinase [Gaiellales bacterium]